MSEAYLILDEMPRACGYCIERAYDCHDNIVCQVEQKTVQDVCKDGTRPDWCALRPLPESKWEPDETDNYNGGYANGWNDCLDAILRGSDD